MTYDQPIYQTNFVNAATLSSSGSVMKFSGPPGKMGRVVSVSCVVTTGVTEAANGITVGSVADADAYATLSVPISAADAVATSAVILTSDDNLIPANGPVLVATDGAATAGAGSVAVVTAWF